MDFRQTPPMFVADEQGLDFLNSISTPVDVEVDWISDGEGLLQWLEQAGMVTPEIVKMMREQSTAAELDAVAMQARALRELFREFVRARMGRELVADDLTDLAPLVRLLEREERYLQVVPNDVKGKQALKLSWARRWKSPEALLLPVAEALSKTICNEDFTYVKACEGPNCTLMFADHTRRRVRRWCSMAVCGNRAKVAAHRARQKEQ